MSSTDNSTNKLIRDTIYLAETNNLDFKYVMLKVYDILIERIKQNNKFGVQKHLDVVWNAILVEEIGEISKAILEETFKNESNLEEELIQVIAVCLAWLESRERNIKEISIDNNWVKITTTRENS